MYRYYTCGTECLSHQELNPGNLAGATTTLPLNYDKPTTIALTTCGAECLSHTHLAATRYVSKFVLPQCERKPDYI